MKDFGAWVSEMAGAIPDASNVKFGEVLEVYKAYEGHSKATPFIVSTIHSNLNNLYHISWLGERNVEFEKACTQEKESLCEAVGYTDNSLLGREYMESFLNHYENNCTKESNYSQMLFGLDRLGRDYGWEAVVEKLKGLAEYYVSVE